MDTKLLTGSPRAQLSSMTGQAVKAGAVCLALVSLGVLMLVLSPVLRAHTSTMPIAMTATGSSIHNHAGITEQHVDMAIDSAPRPACTPDNTNMTYIINGQAVLPQDVMATLGRPNPAGSDRLHVVKVYGRCGAFGGGDAHPQVFFLRPQTSDILVFKEIWLKREFAFLDDIFEQHNLKPRKIMDLGMNCGMASLYFAHHFPGAEIVSVEPGLNTFAVAALNLVHYNNVHRELGAVTAHGGGYGSVFDRNYGQWAMGVKDASVNNLTLGDSFGEMDIPSLMQKYGYTTIDYLKVDIKGSEKYLCQSILEGKADWIQSVKCMTLEYHDRYVGNVTVTCDAALAAAGMHWLGNFGELTAWCR